MDQFIQIFETITSQNWLNLSYFTLGKALGLTIIGYILKKVVQVTVDKLLIRLQKSSYQFDHELLGAVHKPLQWWPVVIFLYMALLTLDLPSEPLNFPEGIESLFRTVTIMLSMWMMLKLFDVLCLYLATAAKSTHTKLDDQLVPIMRRSGRVFIFMIGVLLVMQNLGYSVGSLIASLGLGGAALALASKDTLGNVFGSIVIFFDRPFQVGDWVEMPGVEGTVEDIGLRTTRIRTFANSLITVPNAQFTTTSINNWSRMKKRRIKTVIGVTYGTTTEEMTQALEAIRNIIREDENLHHDFFLVNFVGFGASSLEILVYCFTVSTVWAEHLRVQEEFFLKIMQALEALNLSFAFPTRTIHVESLPDLGMNHQQPLNEG